MKKLLKENLELAEKIQAKAPWNTYEDTDLIYLTFGLERTVFISIMGNAQKIYGVSFYEGEEGLGCFLDIVQNDETSMKQSRYIALSTSCLNLYFDTVEDIKEGPFEHMLEPEYKDKFGKVPYFVRMKRLQIPTKLNDDELKRMNDYLKALLMILDEVDEEGFEYDADREIMAADIDDDFDNDPLCTIYAMPRPVMSTRYFDIEYSDKELKDAMANAETTDRLLIIDCDLIGPFEDDRDEEDGFYADMVFFMTEEGFIADFMMLQPDDDKPQTVIDMLTNYIEEMGIPEAIAVRKSDLEYILFDALRDTEIDIVDTDWNLVDDDLDELEAKIAELGDAWDE